MLSSKMVQRSGATPASRAASSQISGAFFSSPSSWAKVTRSKYLAMSSRSRDARQWTGRALVTTAIRRPSARHCFK